jgi:hypothetical protein
VRTFGRLEYAPVTEYRPKALWQLTCEPHVVVKVKRLFPRAVQNRTGPVQIFDTPEVARDLEWMLMRWPLDVDETTLDALTNRAEEHRATEETVQRILEGDHGSDPTIVDVLGVKRRQSEPIVDPHAEPLAAMAADTSDRIRRLATDVLTRKEPRLV